MVLLSRKMANGQKSGPAPDVALFIVYGVHKSISEIMNSVHITAPHPGGWSNLPWIAPLLIADRARWQRAKSTFLHPFVNTGLRLRRDSCRLALTASGGRG
jgi:hypothetical protein